MLQGVFLAEKFASHLDPPPPSPPLQISHHILCIQPLSPTCIALCWWSCSSREVLNVIRSTFKAREAETQACLTRAAKRLQAARKKARASVCI